MTDPIPLSPHDEAIFRRVQKGMGKEPFKNVRVKKNPVYYTPTNELHAPTTSTAEQHLFERAVNAAWMAHMLGKGTSAPAIVTEDPELPIKQVRELLETPLFRSALQTRGIPAADLTYLTDDMVALLSLLRDTSTMMSERKKCELLGIPYAKFQGWLEYPPFRSKYREIYSSALKIATERGDAVLAQLVEQGNMRAIEYANELTGKYRKGDAQTLAVGQVISMVLSVVQKHVTDEATLQALGNEFQRISDAGGLNAPLVLEASTSVPDAHADMQYAEVVEDEEEPLVREAARGNDDHPEPPSDGGDSRVE